MRLKLSWVLKIGRECNPALLGLIFAGIAVAADIQSLSNYKERYGATKGVVEVDAEKELPRYPAVEPADAIETWQVKQGFRLALATNEPQVRDPIAICFDEHGRMFVCEMNDYSEMRDVTPHLGRISMLEDKDGDGHFESSRIFADDLPWPTGLIWANGGLFVGATPDIWRFEDRDGDGKAEFREKVYTGFGTDLKLLNVQGLMNSFEWGQDNRVHVLAGGGNRGKVSSPKRPELETVDLGGKDFWFDPVTLEFGLEQGGAQYGMSFDNYGRKFGCSNSDHLQYWVYDDLDSGRNRYFQLPRARRSIAADGGAAEVFRISPDEPWRILRTRWRIAGVVKGVVEGGGRVSGYFTGATGTTIYRGDAYGPEFVNNSFTGDAGGQLIHRKVIRPSDDGVSLIGERPADEHGFEFAASRDTWVRVVNFANAPDGCLYVCDMYREVIEHPWSIPDEIKRHIDLNSGRDRGRIYRIEPDGSDGEGRWAEGRTGRGDVAAASTAELVEMLGHSNGWHRDTAQRLLYERQDKAAVPALEKVLAGDEPLAKLHALGASEGLESLKLERVLPLLKDANPRVRERALVYCGRFLEEGADNDTILNAAAELWGEEDERVRFQLALLASRLDSSLVLEIGGGVLREGLGNLVGALSNVEKPSPWIIGALLSGREPAVWALFGWMTFQKSPDEVVNHPAFPDCLEYLGRGGAKEWLPPTLEVIATCSNPNPWIMQLGSSLKARKTTLEKVDEKGVLRGIFAGAIKTASDPEADESSRCDAVELLGVDSSEKATEVLLACLQEEGSDRLQTMAVRQLAARSEGAPFDSMAKSWGDLKSGARQAMLEVMLGSIQGTNSLLRLMADGEGPTPESLPAAQVQSLIGHKDKSIASTAKKVLESVIPPSREEVAKTFAPAVGMPGDAARGRNHYVGRCMACHRAEGTGMELGPDLVTVKTRGREGILEAILNPHKEVAPQYIAYTVTGKDGRTVTGVITRDDAAGMTVKAMGGLEHTFERSEIESSSSAGQSLMPEGLETGMSAGEMADLLRFIEEL